jgi:hypothetical protein
LSIAASSSRHPQTTLPPETPTTGKDINHREKIATEEVVKDW